MILLGLTGGVGMGKSTVSALMEAAGLRVSDTDVWARRLVEPGQPALREIREAFGEDVIDGQGRLRRDVMATLTFQDAAARSKLESILHPRIRRGWLGEVDRWRKAGDAAGVVTIPLLFETGARSDVDQTICVACTESTQRERLFERGWSERETRGRIEAQWPTGEKMAQADFVIWNEAGRDALCEQVHRVLKLATTGMRFVVSSGG